MSAQNFLTSFTNGFMFGMLTSMPRINCCNPFYSPCLPMPSLFMSPVYNMPFMPMYTPMYNPFAYMSYQPPVFNFTNTSFTPSFTNNTSNNLFNDSNWNWNFNSNNTVKPSISTTSTVSASKSTPSYSSPTSSSHSAKYTGSSDKVTDLYKGSVDGLNKKLANRGVLRGKGAKFLEMQEKYGISASFLAAVCIQESSGTSKMAKEKNNVAGITCNGGKEFKKFNSVDECIEYLAKLIKNNYVDKGLITVAQIHKKYCPPSGDSKDKNGINGGWGSGVSGIKDSIDRALA